LRPTASQPLGEFTFFMNERWLSVEEIAAHLGVNPDTIYKWIERKKMPAHKLGRLWKFLASEIDEWIKGGHAAKDVPTAAKGATTKRKLPRR
jgi:excisionase family DNA binding protein